MPGASAREMSLNGAADMKRWATDCWNRNDQGVVWSFLCIAEQEGRIWQGIDEARSWSGSRTAPVSTTDRR